MVTIRGGAERVPLTSSGPAPWQVGKLLSVQTHAGATQGVQRKVRTKELPFPLISCSDTFVGWGGGLWPHQAEGELLRWRGGES